MKKLDKELDKKHKVIHEQVQMMYGLIKTGQTALESLRSACDHPETKFCDYAWSPGHTYPNTVVCSVCGEVLECKEIE